MPFTNYLQASLISQSGVVDNANNRPVQPYEGQMVYQKDTGELLLYDGSDWIRMASTVQPPGVEYINSWSATSGTSLVLTDCFSPAYKNYKLNITNYSNTTTGATLRINFGNSTTAYKFGGIHVPTLSSAAIGRFSSGITTTSYGELGCFTSSNGQSACTVEIWNPSSAEYTNYISIASHAISDNAYGPTYVGCWHPIATAWTDCTISVSTGGFQSINCTMYGYRQ